jgi:hypothetical protein
MWVADGAPRRGRAPPTTVRHRFELTGAEPAYAASGEVEASVLNQFSMSKHQGAFRLATTRRRLVAGR